MADSTSQLDEVQSASFLAKTLAPEDVRVGDFVAPLTEAYDYPSFLWCTDNALTDRQQTVRIEFLAQESGEPLEVLAVCLPFVLVKNVKGKPQTLDVRRAKLARLDEEYAKKSLHAMEKFEKKKGKK